jgi:hypothetical protein
VHAEPVRYSIGYAFVHYLEEEGGSAPIGFLVSAQSTKDLGLKAELAYHRDTFDFYYFEITLNSFTGLIGPVMNYRAGNAEGFVHLLFGGREDRVEGEGTFSMGGELGAGFDLPASSHVFVRPEADVQLFTNEGDSFKVLRLSLGIAF